MSEPFSSASIGLAKPPAASPWGSDKERWAAVAAFALLACGLIWHAASLAKFGIWAVRYPYELDYGEGVVWQQMRRLVGGDAFAPVGSFPAMAINYPPVYYLVSFCLSSLTGADQLAAGRMVSLAALFAAAGLGGAVVFRLLKEEAGRGAATVAAVTASLLMLSNAAVTFWTPLMRVDMLALALSFAGLFLAIVAFERPRFVYAAAVLFVAAVYTKQTMLAAPAASFAVMILLRPRTAIAGIATCLALGLTILGALCWATDGGFARHIFGYNINRLNPGQLLFLPVNMATHAVFLGLAALTVQQRWPSIFGEVRFSDGLEALRERVLGARSRTIFLVLLVYFAIATPMLLLIAKSGANLNYMIEWFSILMLLVALGTADAARLAFGASSTLGEGRSGAFSIIIIAALAAQLGVLPNSRYHGLFKLPELAEMDQLSAMVRAAPKPIISDDMVLLLRSGKEVMVEPGFAAELGSLGAYDERPFIARIRNQDFSFFVTFRERGEPTFDSRYNPGVADAMDAAYPVKRYLAGLTLHLPAGCAAAGTTPPCP